MAPEITSNHVLLTLDHNQDIDVRIETDPANAEAAIKVAVDLKHLKSPRLRKHLLQGLAISLPGVREPLLPNDLLTTTKDNVIYWSIPAAQLPGGKLPLVGSEMTMTLNHQPILPMQMQHDGYRMTPRRAHERLTGNEIKTIANADDMPENLPYSRKAMRGFNPEHHAPVTELHTHLSAQINAATLMEIALKHDAAMGTPGITYPLELLALCGVELNDYQKKKILTVPAIRFDPGRNEDVQLACESGEKGATCQALRVNDLTPEQRDAVVRKMRIAQDKKLPFSRFDPEMYRFRNPFSKRSELNYDIIMKVAEDYQKNGVRYSELSATGMLNNPAWFAEMIRAVDDAKEKFGVDLRFLAAVPRSYDPPQMLRELEKVKYAARHPYVVGVDLLGYEFNSAEDLSWAMKHIAQWASVSQGTDLKANEGWDFAKQFTIRVHAGETGKRKENVAAVVNVADEYGVKARIAHALRSDIDAEKRSGMRKKIRSLSDDELLAFELCPPSNLAYNNLDRIENAPLKYWRELSGAVYLSTDGADAIRSTPTQLALDALAAGWKIEDLEHMRAREEKFIRTHFENEANKRQAFDAHYAPKHGEKDANEAFINAFDDRLKEINGHTIEKEIGERLPWFIMGASGSSYENVPANIRHEVAVAMGMLRQASTPENNAVLLGRVKKEGVSAAADAEFSAHEKANPCNPFKVVAVAAKGTTSLANSLSYIKELPQEPSAIPYNLFKTARDLPLPAFGIFIGGNNFTRDVMQLSHESTDEFPFGRPFVIMNNVPGASADFAADVSKDKQCHDGISMLKAIDFQIRHTVEGQKLYQDRLPFNRDLYREENGKLMLDDAKLKALQVAAEKTQTEREAGLQSQALDKLAVVNPTTVLGAFVSTAAAGKKGPKR